MNPANWKCRNTAYRAPFAPTTSVFDIQDDASVDYSYDVSNSLFYREPGIHDIQNLYGYPHNNLNVGNPTSMTPFHSCFASVQNEFHIQNPQISMAEYILFEVSPPNGFIQNREFFSENYTSSFSANDSMLIGKNVTFRSTQGEVILHSSTETRIVSQRVRISNGFHAQSGSRATISSVLNLDSSCFELQIENLKRDTSTKKIDPPNERLTQFGFSDQDVLLFPNPTAGQLSIQVGEALVDSDVQIFNTRGQLIYKSEMAGKSLDVNLSNCEVGVYTVQIVSSQRNINRKIVLQ